MATYTVVSGDCLWTIAERYLGSGLRWTELADLNGISRSNTTIYPGQVLQLDVEPAPPETVQPQPTYSTEATIQYFGLQSGTDRTVYATWTWDRGNTKEYKTRWWYCVDENVPILGSESTTEWTHSVYTAPANAKRTWFHVKPISETYKADDTDVSYWTANWSTQKTYYFSNNPPVKPSTPTVTLDGLKLTARLDNISDENTKKIQFQIVKDDTTVFNTGTVDITTSSASYSCNLESGSSYKVRARGKRSDIYGEWSDYSTNIKTIPAAPGSITDLRALSDRSVHIEWEPVSTAKTYSIEYTTKLIYFDSSSEVRSFSVDAREHHAEITGMESGEEYFFRVKAVNDQGNSSWTEVESITIGKKPSAPTTWSSSTSVVVGDPLNLYWVHNSQDGSSQTYAELELIIDGVTETHTIANPNIDDEDLKDKTSVYSVNTSIFREGSKIQWRVKTAGVTRTYGDWSVQRTVDVYAPATLQLSITNIMGDSISTIEGFPFYVKAVPGPRTQSPVSYYVAITANETYETTDNIGNVKMVSAGDEVYAQYFDTNEHLIVEMSAHNIDLENNKSYTVKVTVSMNSGLTAEASNEFQVAWIETLYTPNASVAIDPDTLVAYIKPYCVYYDYDYYKVDYNATKNLYVKTKTKIAKTDGFTVNASTVSGEIVYKASDGTYFCLVVPDEGKLSENVKLSVYRREYDGKFTEIARDLINTDGTYTTDPHPALDFARYRIVATDVNTGAVSFYDMPGYPVQEKAIIIQWDEEWSNFQTSEEGRLEQPPWSGSLLKLPYNVDVSDKYNIDTSLVEYIGRENPVSYYGTQRGITSTWNVEIDREDIDTLYALRRLAIWMGDVYVREPSGSGYWANISVAFSQKHCELTIPVTLDIKRVEGGV